MNVNKRARHHGGAGPAHLNWRRVHHTRLFWLGLFLMLVAITVYVMSRRFGLAAPYPTVKFSRSPGTPGEMRFVNRVLLLAAR